MILAYLLIILSIAIPQAQSSLNPDFLYESENRINLHHRGLQTQASVNSTPGFISAVSTTTFYGTWSESVPGQKIMGKFQNQQGFLSLGSLVSNSQNSDSFDLSITFYDGEYTDQEYIEVDLNQDISDFEFNQANSSFYGQDLLLSVKSGFDDSPSYSTVCESDIYIYFIDPNTGGPITPSVNNSYSDNTEYKIQFSIQSQNCSLSISTGILSSTYPMSLKQILIFAGTTFSYALLGALAFKMTRINLLGSSIKVRPISLWSMLLIQYYDVYLMLLNLMDATYYSGYLGFVSLVIFFGLFIPEAVIAFSIHNNPRIPNRENSRNNCKNFVTYYCLLLCLLFLSICLKTIWIQVIPCLFLFPQIVQVFLTGKEGQVNFWFVLCFAITRLGILGYMRFNPENIYRYSPNTVFGISCLGVIILQVMVLSIQNWYPKFGMKKRRFNYKINTANLPEKEEICPICMEQLVEVSTEAKKTGIEEEIAQTPLFQTPCKHRYHARCLKEWMKRKFECPFCKRDLPSVTLDHKRGPTSALLDNSPTVHVSF